MSCAENNVYSFFRNRNAIMKDTGIGGQDCMQIAIIVSFLQFSKATLLNNNPTENTAALYSSNNLEHHYHYNCLNVLQLCKVHRTITSHHQMGTSYKNSQCAIRLMVRK